ncbi:esterase B1-like [Anastrepha obliqua]|uniref:esterase B1-like n=1 Tax=Anastrepha obliqua TaxID=95512 RepID=UPI00240905B5|nr:esterase B1-like [Anastrepha obliqua]
MNSNITNGINPPTVSTTHGKVRGQMRQGVYGDIYYSFDGIPYARPPLGELRFKSPQPAEPWLGVRDCTKCPPKCMQCNRYTGVVEGSEDCLYLNVYVKRLRSDRPLPVIVYLIGGRFTTGDASHAAWGPDYIMMKDVLLITMGFRLGALGFLSFPEPELQVPGNAGLKDIFLALQWIKQNCNNFNGDPKNITLFGHSSGSAAAHLLMHLPQCENLFHKVILMSGTQMYIRKVPHLEYRFAKHLGYNGPDDNHKILAYLNSLAPERLCDLEIWTAEEKEQGHFFVFSLTIESEHTPDAIITKDPLDMYAVDKEAWFNGLPLVLGSNSFESLMHYKYFTKQPKLYETLKVHPEYLVSHEVRAKCELSAQQQLARKLIRLHLAEKDLNIEQVFDVMRLSSYDFIYHPVHRFLQTRLAQANAPTYFYRFDYDSPDFNLYRIRHCGREVRGVSHVDELSYIFFIPDSFKLKRESKEFQMIECMVDWITSFAVNSNPNGVKIKPLVWEPLATEGARYCLNISDELSFIEWPEADTCAIWDKYYKEAGIRLF